MTFEMWPAAAPAFGTCRGTAGAPQFRDGAHYIFKF
jgi:hypothetical protein